MTQLEKEQLQNKISRDEIESKKVQDQIRELQDSIQRERLVSQALEQAQKQSERSRDESRQNYEVKLQELAQVQQLSKSLDEQLNLTKEKLEEAQN